MQRSGSASGLRTRRRTLGLTTAVAVHLLAAAAILPVARLNLQERSRSSDASDPVVLVQLVHLRHLADSAQSRSQSQPRDAPKPKPASLPDKPSRFEVASSEPVEPGPAPPSRVEDDDPLYRVPFRDAVAQADARLRVGLGCEHVDLQQLPKDVLDLCEAARQRDASRARGPYG
jgi:hypothetical protein